MGRRFVYTLGVISGIFSLLFFACGNETELKETKEQPGVVPSASPSPSPSPSQTSYWWKVFLKKYACPYPDCPGEDGFSVNYYRNYAEGADHNPPRATGLITGAEYTVLSALASELALENLNTQPSCRSIDPLPGRTSGYVKLILWNLHEYRIFTVDNGSLHECYRDGMTKAKALYLEMEDLAQKYHTSSE